MEAETEAEAERSMLSTVVAIPEVVVVVVDGELRRQLRWLVVDEGGGSIRVA